ncbi:hypothetical protein EDB81DRAFT_815978 [Dactylonectria macrodidyma]|uniref:Uncharacterized protein n=1 Tax=Dactylonectria macrodidyma TaxID=307937 RepID=A0A9P9DIK5_9HYPO|nr:hypothetical protein EDB81DRAFT_815978 [Dactylonectria macrodidyma]
MRDLSQFRIAGQSWSRQLRNNRAALFLSLVTRIQRVGLLSLTSLLASGIALILFAQNIYTVRRGHSDEAPDDYRQAIFRVGSELSVQSWLAVLGVIFGTLSYGLATAHVHVFDYWCSWRARRATGPGLNYARYLNSQPQAPVVTGLRHGFPVFVVCRYLIAVLGIAASIGYKYVVIEVTYMASEAVEQNQVRLQLPPVRGLLENGTTSPWVGDTPLSGTNRAFLHSQAVWTSWGYETGDSLRPPFDITMVGWANCSGAFHVLDEGFVLTREMVMVANMTEDADEHFVTSEQGDWSRTEGSSGWINGSSSRAIIDYRIVEPGQVQMQWAEMGSWMDDSSGTERQRVERRLTYDMRYAVAEVKRWVSGGSCSPLTDEGGRSNPTFLSTSSMRIRTQNPDGSVSLNYKLLDAILFSDEVGPREGVSAFVHGVMAGWGAQLAELDVSDIRLGHAPPDTEPFGPENTDDSLRSLLTQSTIDYPFLDGTRYAKRRGSYYRVVDYFTALGSIVIVIAVARVAIGPPVLTSWIGQHVHLASVEGVIRPENAEELASGYQVARGELGVLRLTVSNHVTEVFLLTKARNDHSSQVEPRAVFCDTRVAGKEKGKKGRT